MSHSSTSVARAVSMLAPATQSKRLNVQDVSERVYGVLASLWRPSVGLGIHIDRERVSAAIARRGSAPVTALPDIALATPWFVRSPSPAAITELSVALKQIAATSPHAEIYVSLPEPAASYAVFDFDALPASGAALEDLVRWRFGKDFHFDEAAIVCRCQWLGRARGRESVLGVALDRAWLGAVQQALDQAAVVAAAIDTGVRYCFNRFHSQLVAPASDGGLLAVEMDYWTIAFWDAQGAVRFVRSRWRTTQPLNDVVSEFAQALQAYRGVAATDRAMRLFFTGDAAASGEWAAAVTAETGERCEILTPGMAAGGLAPALNAACAI